MRDRLRATACVVGVVLAIELAAGPAARAQDAASERATYADASAPVWGLATTEVLAGAGLLLLVGDSCSGWGCDLLMLLTTSLALVGGVTAAVVASQTDAPPDVPFFAHTVIGAGLGGFALFAGIASVTDGDAGDAAAVAIPGALAMAGAMGTWVVLRRDAIFRNPETATAAHLLTWLPLAVTSIVLAIVSEQSDEDPVVPAGLGLAALLSLGAGIGWVEVADAYPEEEGGAFAAPLFSWSGAF